MVLAAPRAGARLRPPGYNDRLPGPALHLDAGALWSPGDLFDARRVDGPHSVAGDAHGERLSSGTRASGIDRCNANAGSLRKQSAFGIATACEAEVLGLLA